jgi:hypothetical protein
MSYNQQQKSEGEYRDLVICNGCSWTASLLRGSSGFKICPVCGKSNLDVIPVSDNESYTVHIKDKRGIEIEFNGK